MRKIIIVTSSYGADFVCKNGGQSTIVPIVEQSGADGIEIRRELFSLNEISSIEKLGEHLKRSELDIYYSIPDSLFMKDGILNKNLTHYFSEAQQLNAKVIKFSLGYYRNTDDFKLLDSILTQFEGVQLVVENDQTSSGVIDNFTHFFSHSDSLKHSIKMTFDTGNWLCQGVDPFEAAKKLNQYVSYVHVKASEIIGDHKINALPPRDNDQWMELLNHHLPLDVPRGIEFAIIGDDLVSVSEQYVNSLKK